VAPGSILRARQISFPAFSATQMLYAHGGALRAPVVRLTRGGRVVDAVRVARVGGASVAIVLRVIHRAPGAGRCTLTVMQAGRPLATRSLTVR
jgi:hypothetical protein